MGEAITALKPAGIVDAEFHLMQALPAGEPCLVCHDINPELLAAVLGQRHPQGQARGLALGDPRGAFTLRATLTRVHAIFTKYT